MVSTNIYILDEELDEEKLAEIDDFTHSITTDVMEPFFKTCFILLKEVKDGKRKNWRHNVFYGKHVFLDGKRVMKHHLNWLNLDNGDFLPEVVDLFLHLLSEYNPNMPMYNSAVLLPTLIHWATVALADLSSAQARFYLVNGGKHNSEAAFKRMEIKACGLLFI